MRAPSVDTQAPYAGHSQGGLIGTHHASFDIVSDVGASPLKGSLDARMRVPMEMTGRWWEVPTLAPAVHDYLCVHWGFP